MREMSEIIKMQACTDRNHWQPWKNGLVNLNKTSLEIMVKKIFEKHKWDTRTLQNRTDDRNKLLKI